jgi:hypothetical protein
MGWPSPKRSRFHGHSRIRPHVFIDSCVRLLSSGASFSLCLGLLPLRSIWRQEVVFSIASVGDATFSPKTTPCPAPAHLRCEYERKRAKDSGHTFVTFRAFRGDSSPSPKVPGTLDPFERVIIYRIGNRGNGVVMERKNRGRIRLESWYSQVQWAVPRYGKAWRPPTDVYET